MLLHVIGFVLLLLHVKYNTQILYARVDIDGEKCSRIFYH